MWLLPEELLRRVSVGALPLGQDLPAAQGVQGGSQVPLLPQQADSASPFHAARLQGSVQVALLRRPDGQVLPEDARLRAPLLRHEGRKSVHALSAPRLRGQ